MYHILLENKRNSDFAISKKDIVQNVKLPFLHTLGYPFYNLNCMQIICFLFYGTYCKSNLRSVNVW